MKLPFLYIVEEVNLLYHNILTPPHQKRNVNHRIILSVVCKNFCVIKLGCHWIPLPYDATLKSFEYPQHMFRLRNKKNNFLVHTLNP